MNGASIFISMVPAIMSTIAAFFSALSAYRIYKIHYQNRVDLVRAEVILLGWEVKEIGTERFLFIESAVNVGKGPALSFGLTANSTRGGRNLTFTGENMRRDIRPETKAVNLNLNIPLESCCRSIDNRDFCNLIIRLFWTDLHEKKHLVNLLIHVSLDGTLLDSTKEEVLVLNEQTPAIYMLRRKACWFDSHRAFKEALHKEATFASCPDDTPFTSR